MDHLDDVRKRVYIMLIEITFYDGVRAMDEQGRHLMNGG